MWDLLQAWAGRPRSYPLGTQSVDVTADLATVDADYSANPLRGIYVGGLGSVFVKLNDDSAFLEWSCPQGFVIPGVIKAVRKSGTTATKLVGIR